MHRVASDVYHYLREACNLEDIMPQGAAQDFEHIDCYAVLLDARCLSKFLFKSQNEPLQWQLSGLAKFGVDRRPLLQSSGQMARCMESGQGRVILPIRKLWARSIMNTSAHTCLKIAKD